VLHRLWLVFAQWVTVAVAVLFVVQTLKPEWLPGRHHDPKQVIVNQVAPDAHNAASDAHPESYSDAVQHAEPAVVNIYTLKAARRTPFSDDPFFGRFFTAPGPQQNLGSGVVVSAKGYILTNNHVVEGADEVEVAFNDAHRLKARIVGTDPDTDLAVLKVDADNLPVITLGSTESTRVGDIVLAIGNPFGVGQTVTMGIVSALGRHDLGINTFENFIQTDAAINPGNSGGALVDVHGNLIGINSAIYTRTGSSIGIGFAIPVSTAQQVMEELIASGVVTRGWLGVEMREVTPELADSFALQGPHGVLVANIYPGGPADKSGLKPGDIVLEISGRRTDDPKTLLNIVAGLKPQTPARLRVQRNRKELDLAVVVGKRPEARHETVEQ
jgi:serine protease DegQ